MKDDRDVIVWTDPGDGSPAYAQVEGGISRAQCRYTLDALPGETANVPGLCVLGAYAEDNPNYDAEATDPPRPRKVRVSAGPGC